MYILSTREMPKIILCVYRNYDYFRLLLFNIIIVIYRRNDFYIQKFSCNALILNQINNHLHIYIFTIYLHVYKSRK